MAEENLGKESLFIGWWVVGKVEAKGVPSGDGLMFKGLVGINVVEEVVGSIPDGAGQFGAIDVVIKGIFAFLGASKTAFGCFNLESVVSGPAIDPSFSGR